MDTVPTVIYMVYKMPDEERFRGKKDRIYDCGLGGKVDRLLDELKSNGSDPSEWRPSALAKTLMQDPEVVALLPRNMKLRTEHVQLYLHNRRKRQEENADKMLMTGSNGKVLVAEVAKRVERIIEMSATAELAHERVQDIYFAILDETKKAIKEKDWATVKALKDVNQIVKSQMDMMLKVTTLIKGDATLQNIIKAQTFHHRQTIIHGIKPERVPEIIVETLQHIRCPDCGSKNWSVQDAIGAFAKYQSSKAGQEILEAESVPVVEEEDYLQDDPDAEPWDKMSERHFASGAWKEGEMKPSKPKRKRRRRSY